MSIGVEPLAELYRRHGLLMEGSEALYLSVGAESIPLVSASVDVVVARNSLGHVDDPEAVLLEAQRLLRPGGTLILNSTSGTLRRRPSRMCSIRRRSAPRSRT